MAAAGSWSLRCRGPSGQAVLTGLDGATTTVDALRRMLHEKLGVAPERQEVLAGFPPRPLALPNGGAAIASVGIANGDALTVRELAGAPAAAPAPAPAAAAAPPAVAFEAGAFAAINGGHLDEDAALAAALAASMEDAAPAAPAPSRPQQQPRPAAAAPAPPPPSAAGPAPTSAPADGGGAVARRIIASDNSCLFNAVGYVMQRSRSVARELRRVIADAVAADPGERAREGRGLDGRGGKRRARCDGGEQKGGKSGLLLICSHGNTASRTRMRTNAKQTQPWNKTKQNKTDTYNEAFLGQPNAAYCAWILEPKHWGGAIELSILARHYGREIAAYDIQTERCDVYGSGDGHRERCMLIYDGLREQPRCRARARAAAAAGAVHFLSL